MDIKASDVKTLREKTGAGMMACKKALAESGCDIDKAVEILRKKGLASLSKRAEKEAREGIIESYVHAGGRVGVLVEVNCETDFVARNEEFKEFVHNIAMQIAAQSPLYVKREDIPDAVLQEEREIYRQQAKEEKKPDNIIDKIIDGKMKKFYEQVCLLEQDYIKDTDIKVENYFGEIAGKLGENIVIRRFIRYVLGEKS